MIRPTRTAKTITFVISLFVCTLSHADIPGAVLACTHGVPPAGHIAPNPTHKLLIGVAVPTVNYAIVGGTMLAPAASHTQNFYNQQTSIFLGTNWFSWKKNWFTDVYKAYWGVDGYAIYNFGAGTVGVYAGSAACITPGYYPVAFFVPV